MFFFIMEVQGPVIEKHNEKGSRNGPGPSSALGFLFVGVHISLYV